MSATKNVTMNDVRSLLWNDITGAREGTTTIKAAELTNKQVATFCKAVAIESRARETERRLGSQPEAFGELVVATE